MDGIEFSAHRFELPGLRFAAGEHAFAADRAVLHEVTGRLHADAGGGVQIDRLEAASADIAGAELRGPALVPAPGQAASWHPAPLASLNGAIRAEIVDAHLVFDADVTVPVREGVIDFKDATVEHVGPDSRMGVSRMGIHVDAPNGRSYLYQFPSAQVAGVGYERRGSLQLQPFVESLLRQLHGGQGLGITDQARQLFDRTAVQGELRLGDGRIDGPGVQAELQGRAQGANTVRIHAKAVGRGIAGDVDTLSVRDAMLQVMGMQLHCGSVTGALGLRLSADGGRLRFSVTLDPLRLSALRLQRIPPPADAQAPRTP